MRMRNKAVIVAGAGSLCITHSAAEGRRFNSRSFAPAESAPYGVIASNPFVRSFSACGMSIGVCVAQNGREYQEDSWLVMEQKLPKPKGWFSKKQTADEVKKEQGMTVIGVFDGHGGSECSEFVSAYLPACFEEELDQGGSSTAVALRAAILEVDQRFARSKRNHGHVGCTAVVVAMDGSNLVCANTGDSRAVLVRQGAAFDLSSDHSPATRPDEVERIEKLGGILSSGDWFTRMLAWWYGVELCARVYHQSGEGGLNMTRSLGDAYLKPLVIPDPEMVQERVQERDTLLVIASDGLWDVISSKEAAAHLAGVLAMYPDAVDVEAVVRQGALSLVVGAQNRGSSDNITVTVIRLRQ
jgi:serine/threonine protein phosphatase PrpC